jgi:CRP/FNR family nitrogen fixation transcriptional regulator
MHSLVASASPVTNMHGLYLVADRGLSATGPVQHFAQNESIFSEGEAAEVFLKVTSGMVRSYRLLDNGRRQLDAFHAKGDVFGLEFGTEYNLSAEAVCDCTVVAYRLPKLEAQATIHDFLWQQLLSYMASALVQAKEHKKLLASRSAIEKIAGFLIEQSRLHQNGGVVQLLMSRTDIADYLGLTVETVSRTFAALKLLQLIEFSTARDIEIINADGLHQLCR